MAEPLARHLVPVDGHEVPIADSTVVADTGGRLAAALLVYMALITAVITLLPFEFAFPTAPRVMLMGSAFDIVSNVVLFLPLGFLYAVAHPAPTVRLMRVFGVGLLASAAIESVQLFEATRFSSASDVLANGAGALLGAVAQRRLSKRVSMDARTVGRLSLELPLMALVYLLLPLLWINGLAGAQSSSHLWPLLALGLFGASLLAAVQRHHFGPNNQLSRELMAAAACAWFLLGGFPGLAPRPSIVLFGMLAVVAVFVWVRSADRTGARSINRRFESRALWEGAPFYVGYLVLLFAPAVGAGATGWRASLGFGVGTLGLETPAILRTVETLVAFTLLGYMLAEFRGRREARFREGARHIAIWAGGAALVAQLLEGFRADGSASVLRGVLLIAAALYGAWLYHLQRAHVRRLLGRQR